jgi:protocatechuate 3,4-dioxygenase beta subunit
MCTASKTDAAGQGPFFIHDGEKSDDISLMRQDIRGRYKMDAEPGLEMQLHLRILKSKSECMPVPDVEVYVWHTDGQGYYSGFGDPGDQKPDQRYAGVPGQNDLKNTDRFCRGYQITGADGIVSFRSIFPGWYNGRDLHIHFVALKKGSMTRGRTTYSGGDHLFTTQMYFEPEFADMVYKTTEPYLRRTMLPDYAGAIKADEPNNSGLRFKSEFNNNIVVAQMQVVLPTV